MPYRKRHHLVKNREVSGKPDTYHCETCRAEKQQDERHSKDARRAQD